MKKLKVGVVGLSMGQSHIANFQKHPEVEVVAVADTDGKRVAEVCKRFEIARACESIDEMLRGERLDVLSIVTPNKFHRPMTLAALEAGAHVLCEKPMAMNAVEAREMAAAAVRAKKRLMINFSSRFSEQAQAMKRVVEAGTLGDVYFARSVWHRRRGVPGFGGWAGIRELSGGGPLIDLGVHRLDLALWLMNFPKPTWVLGSCYDHLSRARAAAQGKRFDVEDLAAALIKFENGATLEIEASWAANIKEHQLMETRLFGTQGGLVQKNKNETYEYEAEVFLERDGCQFDMALHPPVPEVQSAQYHFIESILKESPYTATAEEGIVVTELLDAIYQSAASGEPVRLLS